MSAVKSAAEILQAACFNAAFQSGWWHDLKTGQDMTFKYLTDPPRRNIGELLALVHSEVSEALEGARKGLMDDKLPHRSMLEVELADTVIRCFDMAGGLGLDLGGAIFEKLNYNAKREDHKREARAAGGKAF